MTSDHNPVGSAAEASRADRDDPLGDLRSGFVQPRGIYLVANSLGPMPAAAAARVDLELQRGWGPEAVSGWHSRGWWELPMKVGRHLGDILGAGSGEVVCGDSTSVQLYQALVALLRSRPERTTLVVDGGEFPGDIYVAEAAARSEHRQLMLVDPESWHPDEDTAVVAFSAVNYATSALRDLSGITAAVHEAGSLVCWDLAHAGGAVPIDLAGLGADAAVGCTYKYFCGGPGAPAYLYLPSRLQDTLELPLQGWHGHRAPFSFEDHFTAAPGVGRARLGTPPVLSMASLDAALEIWEQVDQSQARSKSLALSAMVMERVDRELSSSGITVASPRSQMRGSHVALRAAHGYQLTRALAEEGVTVDFRAPDLIRVGVSALFNTFSEVWRAMDILAGIASSETWRASRFAPDGRTVT